MAIYIPQKTNIHKEVVLNQYERKYYNFCITIIRSTGYSFDSLADVFLKFKIQSGLDNIRKANEISRSKRNQSFMQQPKINVPINYNSVPYERSLENLIQQVVNFKTQMPDDRRISYGDLNSVFRTICPIWPFC